MSTTVHSILEQTNVEIPKKRCKTLNTGRFEESLSGLSAPTKTLRILLLLNNKLYAELS
jgi:hypothetical protein